MRRYLLTAGIIFLLMTAGCDKKSNTRQNETAKQAIYTVERTNLVATIEEEGNIAPLKSVEVKPSISGRVTSVFVNEGDHVKKGQKIAEILADRDQTRSINSIITNYKEAEINFENVKDDYKYAQDLYENNFISERELKDAANKFRIAEMRFESTKEEYLIALNDVKLGDEETAKTSQVLSPLTGIVLEKFVEVGELVSGETSARSGTVLFNIADYTGYVVKVQINEFDIDRVKHGQTVVVTRGRSGEHRFMGKVFKISPLAVQSDGVKVYPVEVEITEGYESLKFGMTAAVKVITASRENVLTIPVTSLFAKRTGENYVMLKQEDGSFKEQQVQRGINNIFYVEITEGLQEGDVILSQNNSQGPGGMGGGGRPAGIPGMPRQGMMRR